VGDPSASGRKYDLYSPAFQASSYETFARMRRDDPVFRQTGLDGKTPIWFVTRYEDAATVPLDDERFVRDYRLALDPEQLEADSTPPIVQLIDNHMLSKDGEEHRRLRRLVTKAFTPRMVEQLRPRIETIAGQLLDAIEADGHAELMEAYAFPLPIAVIAELLGIPTGDRDRFRTWSEAMVMPSFGDEELARFVALMDEFVTYLHELFARRRANPTEDLVSALVAAHEQDDALSEDELVGMTVLLIVAGHETTVGLIGNAVLALLTHPGERERLETEPGLLPTAVEELLRFDSPVERTLNRWATTEVELGGCTIRRGDLVIPILGSANRDEERFAEPDRLDLSRKDIRHLAFGRGSHYCLGAPLARLEAEIALAALLGRFPTLRLAITLDQLAWRPTPGFRRLSALPVTWDSPTSR